MNVIQEENAKPGTTDWQITRPALNGEIEGFASLTSVTVGESIKFYIRAKQPSYIMAFYRMGWYDGKGSRLIHTVAEQIVIDQPEPEIDERSKVECFWKESYEYTIPDDWCTGVYLCKLTSKPDLFECYVIFAVKAKPEKKSTYLFQIATNTYQAYNYWGGYSLYGSKETLLAGSPNAIRYSAKCVSFNRPYVENFGSGAFFNWEYQLVRWMEKEGMDIMYCSEHDLHENKVMLANTRAFICAGHSEYWSDAMYDNIETALEGNNMGMAFFGANAIFWQVRFEDSFNGKNRAVVCYKCTRYIDFQKDPIFIDNPAKVTGQFRSSTINRPEQNIIGQMYLGCFMDKEPNQDMVFPETEHWLFEGAGIKPGEKIRKLVGYEFDKVLAQYPRPDNLLVLARSPVTWKSDQGKMIKGNSNVTIYTNKMGNTVFASGTMSWSWGLDDYNHKNEGLVNEKIQKLTQNILKVLTKEDMRPLHANAKPTAEVCINIKDEPQIKESEQVTVIHKTKSHEVKARVTKSKLIVYFFIAGGIIGLMVGYLAFDDEFTGLITGLTLGGVIGAIVDKLNKA